LIIAGLDPYIGILHSDNYNKKSFVFDFIEAYRILADEPVFYFFSRHKCKPEYYDEIHKGITLNAEGKKVFAPYILEYLDQKIRYRNKNRKRIDMIQTDAHAFANFIIGKKDSYFEQSVARKFENFINIDKKIRGGMMLTWVMYDICENKVRNKIVKICEQAGIYRVQYSVWLGEMNRTKRREVQTQIEDLIDHDVDKVYIFPMCREDFKSCVLLGQAFDKKLITNELIALMA